VQLSSDLLGDVVGFLIPEMNVEVEFYGENPIGMIGSALHCRTSPLTAAAEHLTKSEQVEDVLDIREPRIEPGSAHTAMTETVVLCALLRIGKYGVRLGAFFELLFRSGVTRVLVRMMLHRECPIRTLDLGLGRGPCNA
jgi:hypothetical protein